MTKPQVLVFIDWYLPGFKAGGPIRSMANMVDHLRDHIDIHIVTSDTDYTESHPYREIRADQWTTMPGGESVWYASKEGTTKAVWKELLAQRKWDTVYINGIYSRPFSILPLYLLRNAQQRKVVAVRGMLAKGPMQFGRIKKRSFIAIARAIGLYRGVHFHATNQEEALDIKKWLGKNSNVSIVPNLARKLAHEAPKPRVKSPSELSLVSIARIAKEKNTLLAIEALALVKSHVEFHLIGPIYDDAYWSTCQRAIAALPPNIIVKHRGTMHPDLVNEELAKHHGLLMPSAGENFGHTMLESLSAGTPLVISDTTPWRELEEKKAGWDIEIGTSNAASLIAERIEQLSAMDRSEFEIWSHGAFALGKRYLSDPTPVEQTRILLTQ